MEFWFDFASTYSYLSAMRIEKLSAEANVAVRWRAFLLGPVFQQQGWNDSPFNLQPAKGRYMWRDIERICERDALPFRRPSVFPRNGVFAARIACAFADAEWMHAFVRAVFLANFSGDRDISDERVITKLLDDLQLPAAAIVKAAQSPKRKSCLREQTEEAIRRGVFGAPTFFVGEEMFWGNDRLEVAMAWMAGNTKKRI